MKRKSQIQISETIAVLFVFFVLILIGFVFYVRVLRDDLTQEQQEISQLRSIAVAQRIMFLPEIQCSEDNVIRDNCIDVIKLQSAYKVINDPENQLYYFDILEFSVINVSIIYPEQSEEDKSWVVYSRKRNDYKNKFVTNVPVSLYDPIEKQYGFGVLKIETYSG